MHALVLLFVAAGSVEPHSFRLPPGDYRYIAVPIKRTPAQLDCRFHVLAGDPSVHLELLRRSDLRSFTQGRDHDTVAATSDSASGGFRSIVDDPGEYEVVIANAKQSPLAIVSLEVSVNTNPDAMVHARELPPRRRLAVILISFSLFFTIVIVSGVRLLRAIKETR